MEGVLVKAAIDVATAFIKTKIGSGNAPDERTIAFDVERHLRETLSWSSRVQFYGMNRAEETEASTIGLKLSAEPRRFRGRLTTVNLQSESDLLSDARNYILLGDPGAGKTTTIKRLIRRLILEPPDTPEDDFQIPILVRLRELTGRDGVSAAVASAVGMRFEERIRPDRDGARATRSHEFWFGTMRLETAVIEFLNSVKAVLFLDGLDEIPSSIRRAVTQEITSLALNISGSKIIASCRTGDYTALIEGFDLVEICPLTTAQITTIAKAWLDNPVEFQRHLSRVPYQDIVDRPLLLTQLLFLFKRYGYLPEQPSQVYKKVIGLLLSEWDAERGIVRSSEYAGFDPDRKAAFLSAMAYYLTYRTKRKQFSASDLETAYLKLHDAFRLPSAQARQVAAELETHTGIIVAASDGAFEFSHLSLQEYLCAEYLVREPFAEHTGRYLIEYPAPVAIAVTLSSNPSAWFAGLILRSRLGVQSHAVASFLSRLILERPFFAVLDAFGVSVMKLYRDALGSSVALQAVDEFTTLPSVAASIDSALNYYQASSQAQAKAGLIRLDQVRALKHSTGFPTPDAVYVPIRLLESLAEHGSARAHQILSVAFPHGVPGA